MVRAKDVTNLVEGKVEQCGQMGKGERFIQIRGKTEPHGAKIMMAWTLHLCPRWVMMKESTCYFLGLVSSTPCNTKKGGVAGDGDRG